MIRGPNLLVNPSFEDGVTGWYGFGTGEQEYSSAYATVTNELPRTGPYCAKIGGVPDSVVWSVRLSQRIPKENFRVGGAYWVDARYRGYIDEREIDPTLYVYLFPAIIGWGGLEFSRGVTPEYPWHPLNAWGEMPPEHQSYDAKPFINGKKYYNSFLYNSDVANDPLWHGDVMVEFAALIDAPSFEVGHTLNYFIDDVEIYEVLGVRPPCAIATAAYGSPLAPQLNVLRTFRDRCLPRRVTNTYYKLSPPVARWLWKHERARCLTRYALEPIVKALAI